MQTTRSIPLGIAVATFAAFATSAVAQEAEDASLVPLFLESCTRDNVSAEAILANVTGSSDWTEVTDPIVDVEALSQVPSNQAVGGLRRPSSVRAWHRDWNGRQLSLVLADFPERNAYHHACILLAPGIRNAIPYLRPMRDGIRVVGLSAKSTDIPHYQEYSGRLADQRRARADIFSRSQVMAGDNVMHLYIAFE